MLSSSSPRDAMTHEIQSKPMDDNLCTNGPAKCRITNMRALTYTSSKMPGICTVRLRAKSTHCPGASSVAAVRNMEQKSTRNSGFSSSRNISPIDTPAAARSVGGNRTPMERATTARAGRTTTNSFACHSIPIPDITTPRRPPITKPPGHQA